MNDDEEVRDIVSSMWMDTIRTEGMWGQSKDDAFFLYFTIGAKSCPHP